MLTALLQHIQLVSITLLISVAIATLITALIRRAPRMGEYVQGALGALYSVPSLALFALLIPLMGIGRTTALVVLVAYNQFLLVRNFDAGLDAVDPGLVEAAKSLGMPPGQTFLHVQFPMAVPVFVAGIRLAAISTIGIATIAAVIDAGGLGVLLFDGLRSRDITTLLWGTALAAGLAIMANTLLSYTEKLLRGRESS